MLVLSHLQLDSFNTFLQQHAKSDTLLSRGNGCRRFLFGSSCKRFKQLIDNGNGNLKLFRREAFQPFRNIRGVIVRPLIAEDPVRQRGLRQTAQRVYRQLFAIKYGNRFRAMLYYGDSRALSNITEMSQWLLIQKAIVISAARNSARSR